MKIIRIALVGPDQMTPQIQQAIQTVGQWLNKVELGVQSQNFSEANGLVTSINQLNALLKANPVTTFVPIKSHSDQLVNMLDLYSRKLNMNTLNEEDIKTLMLSISNYRKDLSSVL
jgi:hypothetical protein